MTLLRLCRRCLCDGKLSAGHARTLLILDAGQQVEQTKKIVALGLSVRQTEKMIGELSGKSVKKNLELLVKIASASEDKDLNTLALEREVSNVLGMGSNWHGKSTGGRYDYPIQIT